VCDSESSEDLGRLEIRPRPFYNTRHTYITYMLEVGAKASLDLSANRHQPRDDREALWQEANVLQGELDSLIGEATERGAARRWTAQTRNLPGTFQVDETDIAHAQKETPDESGASSRAGDRGRTGDVQLGKLAFYH
jgi:hypothetical protein